MKNKKGFTLIELLAIIVILAIIAVITIPILLNVIENARKGSAVDSAYGFKDSINKYYITKLSSDRQFQLEGEYTVTNGKLTGPNITDEDGVSIPISGTIPSSGSLTYSNNTLTEGCLVIGEYAVTFTGSSVANTVKGGCGPDLTGINYIEREDGYKYLDSTYVGQHEVYFNPTDPSVTCTKDNYVSTNSNAGNTEGCLKWYAYSVKGNVVNMILDHDINPSGAVAWVSMIDYNNSGTLGASLGVTNMNGGTGEYGSYGNHDKGPLTSLNYLKTNTSSWTTTVKGDYATYIARLSTAKYKIDYTIDVDENGLGDYKARLITAQEVAYISGQNFDETSSTSTFNGVPSWLVENFPDDMDRTYGFWTSSPCAIRSDFAWIVGRGGAMTFDFVWYPMMARYGIRPVITVPASVVFSS